jgi:hypothetical protein
MASLNVHVHAMSDVNWKPLNQLVPLLGIRLAAPSDAGGGQPAELKTFGLQFTDPDGETHVYRCGRAAFAFTKGADR